MNDTQTQTARRRFRPFHGGLALLALGGALVIVGSLQTTTTGPADDCPAGSELVAKFNYQGGSYVFEKPSGNSGVVTLSNTTAEGGTWSSTQPIGYVIVKGGPGSVTTSYTPPATGGTFSNEGLPLVGSGNRPDISNLQFCGAATPPTTDLPGTDPPGTDPPGTDPPGTDPPGTDPPGTDPPGTDPPGTDPPGTDPVTTTTDVEQIAPVPTTVTPTVTPTTGPTPTTVTPTTEPTVEQLPSVTSTSVLADADQGTLPSTGSPSIPLIVLGLVLIAAGATISVVGRARDRHTIA